MDEPFYYLSAEDRVPRDAVHVIVGGSVTAVAPGTFQYYQNLARVELQEGVEEIGANAFANCPNLTRVDCLSTLRTIGDEAFAWCERLLELILREGLRWIGESAFKFCGLERITVPSSVVEIGIGAFASCERLSEVNLTEGLGKIGARAFNECNFRRISVPSSVVKIGEHAFADCDNLEAVTLAGGKVMVGRGAFDCPRLGQIGISSMAVVVETGEDGDDRAATVTREIEQDPTNESSQLVILASPHLVSMRPEDLANMTDAINRITNLTRGEWGLDLLDHADRDVFRRIRNCFVYHLSMWYRWYKREVATILELGLWKIELGRAREASQSRAAGGGDTAGADVPTKDDCRRMCGADPIVGLVLSSLAGPHRRADQSENAGSIQP